MEVFGRVKFCPMSVEADYRTVSHQKTAAGLLGKKHTGGQR
jgi:hypothetical protein